MVGFELADQSWFRLGTLACPDEASGYAERQLLKWVDRSVALFSLLGPVLQGAPSSNT